MGRTALNYKLRKARYANLWTIEQVARKVGVDSRTYLRWEQGIQTPRFSSLRTLCKVFDTSPEVLGFSLVVEKPVELSDELDLGELDENPF